jgi:glutamine phosphoribosylpyrophosphate amidotransferase
MCGIAGFSLAPDHALSPTAVARVLLAGIAERGRDATGYAHRCPAGPITIAKDSCPLADMIASVAMPGATTEAIVHVREYTKGVPGINDNNHPIRWGGVVGVHNGHLTNDDELFESFARPRSTPQITVDSEAIMMLADVLGSVAAALEQVQGSAAVAVLRDERPGRLTLARRSRRPIVIGRAPGVLLFASTRQPIELVAEGARLRLRYEEVAEGTAIDFHHGEEVARERFAVEGWLGKKIVAYPHVAEKDGLVRSALAGLRRAS